MNFLNEYLLELLGTKSIVNWAASFTFIVVGVIVSLRLSAYKRDKDSPNTPYTFNLLFLIRDNISRLIGSVFVAFAIVRFGEHLLGITIGYEYCFVLGLCFDQAYKLLIEWQNKARDIFKSK